MQRVLSQRTDTSLKFVKEKRHGMEKADKSEKKDVEGSYVNLYPKPFGCGGFYVNTQTWTLYRLSYPLFHSTYPLLR